MKPHIRGCRYVKDKLTVKQSERAGYNAPAMAFDSRRICLMDLVAGNFRLIYGANIQKNIEFK